VCLVIYDLVSLLCYVEDFGFTCMVERGVYNKEIVKSKLYFCLLIFVCKICVGVCARLGMYVRVCLYVCVCVCVKETEYVCVCV